PDRTRDAAQDSLLLSESSFIEPGVLHVGSERLEADAFIVATGSSPVVPKALEGVATRILTTDTLFDQDSLPKRLGILGMGAVGLELGLALARLDVEVIGADQRHTIGGIQDPMVQERAISAFISDLPMWLGDSVEIHLAGEGVLMRTSEHRAVVD